MTSSADHAATVQAWVRSRANPLDGPLERQAKSKDGRLALAALVALAERATELERQRNEWAERIEVVRAAREAAEARATERERELSGMRALAEHNHEAAVAQRERAERAEMALRDIIALDINKDPVHIARAALGETA